MTETATIGKEGEVARSASRRTAWSLRSALILCSIVTVGAILRFHQLESRGMFDEAASWTFAQLPWPDFVRAMWNYEGNMVFYYALLRWWIHLGDSEWTLRSLSVFFALATIFAVYVIGNRFFNKRVGFIASALLATHAFHVRWSQEARSYCLVTFLAVLSIYFFLRWTESPDNKAMWWGYVATSSLTCYSHVFGGLVLMGQWLSLDVARRRRLGIPRIAKTLATLALATLPMAVFVLFRDRGQLEWVQPLTLQSLLKSLWMLTGAGGNTLLLVYFFFVVSSIWTVSRRPSRGHRGEKAWCLRVLLFWLFFPISSLSLVSLFRPVLVDRFLLMSTPALVIVAALGIDRFSQFTSPLRRVTPSAVGVILILSGLANYNQMGAVRAPGNNWQAMTRHILADQRPGDAAFFFPAATHMSFNYYANQELPDSSGIRPTIAFPAFDGAPSGAQPNPTKGEVRAAVRDYEGVWLVLNLGSIVLVPTRWKTQEMIRSTIAEELALENEITIRGVPTLILALYRRKPQADEHEEATGKARRAGSGQTVPSAQE